MDNIFYLGFAMIWIFLGLAVLAPVFYFLSAGIVSIIKGVKDNKKNYPRKTGTKFIILGILSIIVSIAIAIFLVYKFISYMY